MANENLAVIYRNTSYQAILQALKASGIDCVSVSAIASHAESSATLYELHLPNIGLMELITKLDTYQEIMKGKHRVTLNKYRLHYDPLAQYWVVQTGIRLKERY